MAGWLSVAEARVLPGLKLVLTAGVPGPWSEAAKGFFHVKRIPFVRVRQEGGGENEDLVAWTGIRNAPQAIYGDEPALSGWAEILFLAERLAPQPRLVPEDPGERALMFGLAHEIAGQQGLGWTRRLMLLAPAMRLPEDPPNPLRARVARMAGPYGYSDAAAAAAPERVAQILRLLAGQLARQLAAGSDYLVGRQLSALDIQWATFAAMLQPLPPELCPMPGFLREQYGASHPAIADALDPALLAHRDRIYRDHLELPVQT